MNHLPIYLFLTALWIGLLPYSGDAREMGCFGRDGFACYCCAQCGTLDAREAFSSCPCPCPGPELSPSLAQDLITAPAYLDLDLGATACFDSSNPVPLNYFGTAPQKPPPFLLS
jgi:hypothetical protein